MTAMTAMTAMTSELAAAEQAGVPTQATEGRGGVVGDATRTAVVVVAIEAELDLASVARVREQLHEALEARPARLVVDLSDCPFVDASALTMLLDVHRRAWRAGGVLTLRGCSPRVLRLLSLTGLRRVFDLAD